MAKIIDVDGNEGESMMFNMSDQLVLIAKRQEVTSLESTSSMEAHRAEISQMMAKCEKRVAELEVKMEEVGTRLEMASKESSEAISRLCDVQNSLTTFKTELHEECKKRADNLQAEVREKAVQIEKLNTKAAELEEKLRLSQDENANEKQQHKTKDKAVEDVISERNLLMAKCSKVEKEIALLEKIKALSSLRTSPGYRYLKML